MRALLFLCLTVAAAAVPTAFAAAAAADAPSKCHNITGTCYEHGFQCANDEVVPHAKRCNGVEDCADGTDEFMCTHDDPTPLVERSDAERHAVMQTSCAKCTCQVAVLNIASSSGWFQFARRAPTDFLGLMTGTGPYRGLPCNPNCVTSIRMGFYKKFRVCRGWLCCARQRECLTCQTSGGSCTAAATSGTRCYG